MSSIERTVALLWPATLETFAMVAWSLFLSHLLGIPLGLLLVLTGPGGVAENKLAYRILDAAVNFGRSVPFVILTVSVVPLTRFLTGTSIGPVAAVVPLTLAALPFVARLTETAVLTVDRGTIEACISMGASRFDLIRFVFIPESLPSLVSGMAITAVNLVGYSAMAGAIGGGGLGDLAVRFGYQRWETGIMLASVAVLVAGVQIIQLLGDRISRRLRR